MPFDVKLSIPESATTISFLSPEVRVALSPYATYASLVATARRQSGPRLVGRLARIVLTIAVVGPMMAIQRVTVGLVATAALSWSFIVLLQVMIGAAVIATARRRPTTMRDALDLWFAGQLPYALWMLLITLLLANSTSFGSDLLFFTALVPAIWTGWIVHAFCRTALGTTATGAHWRVALHQAIVWTVALSYAAWSAGGWFQIYAPIARLLS